MKFIPFTDYGYVDFLNLKFSSIAYIKQYPQDRYEKQKFKAMRLFWKIQGTMQIHAPWSPHNREPKGTEIEQPF